VVYRVASLFAWVRVANLRTVLTGLLLGVFFVCFYVHVWQGIDPRLLYYAHQIELPSGHRVRFPVYFEGSAFFDGFSAYPGGLAEYAAARCSQYFFYNLRGPLILTGVAAIAYLAMAGWIRALGIKGSRVLPLVAPLLLLVTYNRYTFRLENYFAPLAALMLVILYIFLAKRVRYASARLPLFAALSAAGYYAVGGPYVLFAVLCALFELLVEKRRLLGASYVLAAVAIPLLGMHVFDVDPANAYFHPSGIYPSDDAVKTIALSAFYLFFVLTAVALPLRERLARWKAALASRMGRFGKAFFAQREAEMLARSGATGVSPVNGQNARDTRQPSKLHAVLLGRLGQVGSVPLLLIGSLLVAFGTLDRDARSVLRSNYLARTEQWPEFLDQIRRYASQEYPDSVMVDVNRALFETGQLGSRMFSYPQKPGLLFRLGEPAADLKGGCDVLLRLGRVNEAEHAALEALEIFGRRPEILRHLAIIYVVKDMPQAARVFFGALSKDIIHGRWARDYLRHLEEDPTLSSDEQVRELRSVMPLCDMINPSEEKMLLAQVVRNRKNRMAFEYLMAHYLLTRQPGKVACTISRLDDFDYPGVPEHYAEAVLLYAHNVGKQPDLGGRGIEESVHQRVRAVIQTAVDTGGDKQKLDAALTAGFPHTACRYLLTGKSGGIP